MFHRRHKNNPAWNKQEHYDDYDDNSYNHKEHVSYKQVCNDISRDSHKSRSYNCSVGPNTTNIFYIQPKSFAMHIVKASYFQSKQIRKTYLNMLQMQHIAAFVDELVFRLQCHDE